MHDNPEAEFRQGLTEYLGLTDNQLDDLLSVVNGIRDYIDAHKVGSSAPSGMTRRQRNDELRKIRKRLERVEEQIASSTADNDRLLTPILSRFLAEVLSNDGIELALREGIHWSDPRGVRISNSRNRDLGYSELEDDYRDQRQRVSQERTEDLLQGFLREIQNRIDQFLELEASRHRGGAPARIYRNLILDRLAKVYPEIFGSQPTITPEGHFFLLCRHVLEYLGESIEGLETAAQRRLAKMKRQGLLPSQPS